MITDVLNELIEGESTAQAVVRYFMDRGISRSTIRGHNLLSVYHALNHTAGAHINVEESGAQCQASKTPVSDPVWAVIVETRKHPALEFVVCLFARMLNVGIQIFHGPANRSFIANSAIRKLMDSGQVHLTDLGIDRLTVNNYNALLLRQEFWASVYGREKILIFQTDAILCSNSEFGLDNFMGFDYIGSKWRRKRPVGIVVDGGGNGGLSLRDWRLTMQCLRRFPADHWPGGEDGYFVFHFDLMGASVAKLHDCAEFSSQIDFSCKSLGGHNIKRMDESALKQFLIYCPEAESTLA